MAGLFSGELYYRSNPAGNPEGAFFFPAAVTATVRQRPVEDATRRFTKYQNFNILIEVLIYRGCDDAGTRKDPLGETYNPLFPDSGLAEIDTGMGHLRRILAEPGGLLIYRDKGMGVDFFFRGSRFGVGQNIPTTTPKGGFIDTTFGPKTRLLVFEPVGGQKCYRLIWEVEITFADCGEPEDPQNFISEFFYDTNWTIDECGLTTRTITGQYEVPVARNTSKIVELAAGHPPHADFIRQTLNFAQPLGFKRRQNYTLSSDRRTISFNVVDTEIDSDFPYKRGICQCSVTETVQSKLGHVLAEMWEVDISGTINVAVGYPKWFAWLAFQDILRKRMRAVQIAKEKSPISSATGDPVATISSDGVIITGFRMSEEIYGRSMSFAVKFYFGTKLSNLFTGRNVSALWVAIEHDGDQGWASHQDSMFRGAGPWSQRGVRQLAHNADDDSLIALCFPPERYGSLLQGKVQRPEDAPDDFEDDPKDEYKKAFEGNLDPMIFETKSTLIEKTGTIPHTRLGGAKATHVEFNSSEGLEGTGILAPTTAPEPIIQQRHASVWEVKFSGYAMRKGVPLPRVSLMQHAGVKVESIGDDVFEAKEVRAFDGTTIHMARWSGTYRLLGQPTVSLTSKPRAVQFA